MFRLRDLAVAAFLAALMPPAAKADPPDANSGELRRVGESQPIIGFQSARHDFGKVIPGTQLRHDFYFMNNGTSDLIIEDVSSRTSGITVSWSKTPVPPSEIGSVRIDLDTTGFSGLQHIRIYLKSNAANGDSVLYISAEIDGTDHTPD